MARKKGVINPIATYPGSTIDLAKFNLETEKRQYEIIEAKLKEIYEDNLEVTKKHVMKVLSLTYNPKDDYVYLPYDLKVSKEKLDLNFEVVKRVIGIGWLIFGIWLLLFALIGSTYLGFRYMNIASLNKDIDGDGIADINIDSNNDGKAEVNIDTNGNNKPDLNIDYMGRRKPIFNLDTDGDGKPDKNLVNDASDEDKRKECTINCDINGDGWPDTNLDLDGDGKPDTNIDTDGDGAPDLNIDVNGDGLCDVMCDDDDDNKCDRNCIKPDKDDIGTGSSTVTGDPSTETGTSMLIIRFTDGETVNVDNLVPDDQPHVDIPKPYKEFTIENLSGYTMEYTLKWIVIENSFVTDHFQYKVTSNHGGLNTDFITAPKENGILGEKIVIAPGQTQEYRIDFRLYGINDNQNIDQSRIFKATIDIEV